MIALAILGVIATFTIPKVLTAQTSAKNIAIIKESAAMIAIAYQQAQLAGAVTAATTPNDLSPYFNYVKMDTASTIDHTTGNSSSLCSAASPCFVLHNGAFVQTLGYASFSATTPVNFISVRVDPDGVYSGTTNGEGKAVGLNIFYDGLITSFGNHPTKPGCYNSSYAANQCNSLGSDPPWFNW